MTTDSRADLTDEQIIEAARREQCFIDAGGEREFTPQFGDTIRGIWASDKNPHRDGFYIRTVRRTGKLNPGTYYELTDGKGNTWEYTSRDTVRIARAIPAAPVPSDAMVKLIADLQHRARYWRQPGIGDFAPKDAAADFADEIERALAHLSAVPALPTSDGVPACSGSCCDCGKGCTVGVTPCGDPQPEAYTGPVTWTPEDEARLDAAIAKHYAARAARVNPLCGVHGPIPCEGARCICNRTSGVKGPEHG